MQKCPYCCYCGGELQIVQKRTLTELTHELTRVQQATHERWVKFMAENAERDKGYEAEEYECDTVVGEDTVVGAADFESADVDPEPDDDEPARGKQRH